MIKLAFTCITMVYYKMHEFDKNDFSLHALRTSIMKKMCDGRWEVRDTAVQTVINVINDLYSE